jgi:polyisoprenoid-binding protein YceI
LEGGEVVVDGRLQIKDHAGDVQVRGVVSGPVTGFDGKRHIALELTATVDRTEYGLEWQATTTDGTDVLGNEVALEVRVELVEA